MKLVSATLAAPALLAVALLAGCGRSAVPDTEPSASAAATSPEPSAPASVAAPIASEPAAPLLKAASYPPRDECRDLPGWSEFRSKLENAVTSRDADALAALTAPDVQLDFGGGQGPAELKRRLNGQTEFDYKLWDQIAATLRLGCGFKKGEAFLPWIYWNAPEIADPYSAMLVLGNDVSVRANANPTSRLVARLNWALVTIKEGTDPTTPVVAVNLPDGRTGYMEGAKLRSLIDYRLIAERGKQGWQIVSIIAGD